MWGDVGDEERTVLHRERRFQDASDAWETGVVTEMC
jgi:hypothetical protein